MKIALLGYGKMGKTIEQLAKKKGHKIVFILSSSKTEGNLSQADVAIDFSTPDSAFENIKMCLENNVPVVSGTTAWLDKYDEAVALCKQHNGSFLYASNFSIGVNLFFKINQYVAKLMQNRAEYDVAIEEIHHTQKLDAPSGTAITLAQQILPFTQKKEWILDKEASDKITITAKRENEVKGTHTIRYSSLVDTVSIKHEAHSREGFALGALMAAGWLIGKKGVFSMEDVIGEVG